MPKWLGVDPDNGAPMWETFVPDLDESGNPIFYIDENGNTQAKMKSAVTNKLSEATQQLVGKASPLFSGGLSTNLRFWNFTLSANGNFVVGNQIYNKDREHMDSDGAYTGLNQMSIKNGLGWKRWKKEGDVATHPALVAARADGSNGTSSRYLEDGSFFRLRNVTLAYALPQTFLQKVKMAGGRINQMSIKNGLGWKRWKKEGDVATHPALVAARADGSNGTSSRYLEDGSFFRLRNVTLSYNMPQTFLQRIKMSGGRIYVSADNIFTLHRFSGMDPEVRLDGDTYHHAGLYSSNYPVPLSVVLGIDVKF